MKRASMIQDEVNQINTIGELTGVFESIASLKISKLRGRVIASKEFFAELWNTYRQLRVNPAEQLGRRANIHGGIAFVAVTSDGKLSGEIDDQVVKHLYDMLNTDAQTQPDIIAIGSHGASKLREYYIDVAHVFPLPDSDEEFSVGDIIEVLSQYDESTVFYQTYESLRSQKVARIDLNSAVRTMSDEAEEETAANEIVSSKDYIFEPDINEIANYLETQMMGVALTQVIMESKLAQHASRFNAMNAAKNTAHDISASLTRQFHRSKRGEADERLKEAMKVIINGGVA